jgi:hypothetical protein
MLIRATKILLLSAIALYAANGVNVEDLNANVQLPAFNARISIGFNYDLLRCPTDVSFEYPRGFMGFNIPLEGTRNLRDFIQYIDPAKDSIFMDSTIISNGKSFKPVGSARQYPNMSVMVDVPMMGGVASFSTTQNFFLGYENSLGNPNIFINPDSLMDGVKFLLRGTVNVPLSLSMSWETMTFGYAYRINKMLTMALNLHRHLFTMDLRGKVDADILGRFVYETDPNATGGVSLDHEIDYSSDKVYGRAYGHYDAEVWTPTVGLKAWRFTLTSRFGFKTKAHGQFYAQYSLPFFIDPKTFQTTVDFTDPNIMNNSELRQKLLANAADSVTVSTKKIVGNSSIESDLEWRMPTGLTLAFDIIPEHLRFSYTKLFGEVAMKLDRIAMETKDLSNEESESAFDSLTLDFGVQVDNIMVLECKVWNAFLNIGVFGIDFRYEDQKNLLGKNMPYMHLGDAAMIPTLSLGAAMGTKLKLLLELNVLPLPALKTGVYYYF